MHYYFAAMKKKQTLLTTRKKNTHEIAINSATSVQTMPTIYTTQNFNTAAQLDSTLLYHLQQHGKIDK